VLDSDAKFILISGSNGVGKTNILEAISLLAPGRGLRSAKFNDILRSAPKPANDWVVRSVIASQGDTNSIATAYSKEDRVKRQIKINETIVKKQSEVLDYVRILWLTPQMDGVFMSSPSVRRRFLDRLTYNFFPSHAKNVAEYEYFTRSRSKILSEIKYDDIWLTNIEKRIADISLPIAKIRLESLQLMNSHIKSLKTKFLKPIMSVKGSVEEMLDESEGDEVHEYILQQLRNNRVRDARAKRSNYGTHLSDLKVTNTNKNIEAALSSTGEQKAMLISILLGQIKAMNELFNCKPIVLLDEVFAHLDDERKEQLADELKQLEAQVWITSTESDLSKYFPESVNLMIK
jgi:DNA replication and repair protein RecF